MTKKLVVRIPPPHNKQAEIEACDKKRILINAGRRAGKTFMVSRISIRQAERGRKVLYIAPVSSQTDAYWELLCTWLQDAIAVGLVKKNETKRTLTFVMTGGRIQALTGKLPDHLRGGSGDYIILDEYAYQNEIIWTRVCAPMTADTNANVIFISTPDFRNHFYLLYLKAMQDPSWAVFTFSTLENPHLSQEALEALTKDMTEEDYRQEILAEFLPGEGTVFRVKPEDFYKAPTLEEIHYYHKDHRLVAGLDWGQKDDFTVLSVGCSTCCREVMLRRMKEIDYPTQRDWLKIHLADIGMPVALLAEENSIGLPNIQQLRRDGIEVAGFTMSNSSKAGLVQGLRLAFHQGSWKWIEDKDGWLELEAYQQSRTPSGLFTYGAAAGMHDDIVTARMIMHHMAVAGRFTLA